MRSASGTRTRPLVVDAVLTAAHLDGAQIVEFEGQSRPLREWLTIHREITRLTRPFLVQHAERAGDAALGAVLKPGNEDSLRRTLKDLQVVDVLQRHPARVAACGVRRGAAAAGAAAVLDRVELRIGRRRGAPDGRRDRLRNRRAASSWRGLGVPGRRHGRRREGARVHRAQRALPPAGRHVA